MLFRSGFIFILLIGICLAVNGQVKIAAKNEILKRTGDDVRDFKREFEVRSPVFESGISPDAAKIITGQIDYWKVFDLDKEENLKDDDWLSSFDFEVKYNKNNILCIWLIMDGVGAYADGGVQYFTFDTRSGKKITFADIFIPSENAALLKKIREKMRVSEAAFFKENPEAKEIFDGEIANLPDKNRTPENFELKHLDGFSVSDDGVTFIYDYAFPHYARTAEPLGEFFLSFKELRTFIRRDGLLARFIR